MNVDLLGEHAARVLRDTVQVDTADALTSLQRLDRRRSSRRRAALLGAAAVVAATAWIARPWITSPDDQTDPQPAPPGFAQLDEAYDVTDMDVTQSGAAEVVAALHEGFPSVVLVRRAGSPSFDVVWSSPTEHELGGGEHVPWPVAVNWAPDESQIAILVAHERDSGTSALTFVDLSLVTINPDGSGRHVVDEVGTCRCADSRPTMTWSDDQLVVGVPDGPDRGDYTREMP